MIHVCQLPDIDMPALYFLGHFVFVTEKSWAFNVRLGILLFCARVFVCVCVRACMSVSVFVSLFQALNQEPDFFQDLISILNPLIIPQFLTL
jgi:hypothetical protein